MSLPWGWGLPVTASTAVTAAAALRSFPSTPSGPSKYEEDSGSFGLDDLLVLQFLILMEDEFGGKVEWCVYSVAAKCRVFS